MENIRTSFNNPRFQSGSKTGHYESWFIRANHPSLPEAVWLRYTIFSPKEKPEEAMGELWAIYFNGKTGKHFVSKSEFPIRNCSFKPNPLEIQIGDSKLDETHVKGISGNKQGSNKIEWDLKYSGKDPSLFLFPENLYSGGFPKAKVLVGHPRAIFTGIIKLDGKKISIKNWIGSQNHNWGSKHTDEYAWGQVAGFENEPDSFLEIATARIKIGPFLTPPLTPIILRFKGIEYKLNSLLKCFGRADYHYFGWNFHASSAEISVEGKISANKSDFICLKYNNPPGGWKYCLNSKIARAEILVTLKNENSSHRLVSKNSAAFEILTSDDSHGFTPVV
ncbi:MAG: hypothetical protein K8R21_10270 [Leptospira sp.]|nr:hypothetical protein [Leptospira sp.]